METRRALENDRVKSPSAKEKAKKVPSGKKAKVIKGKSRNLD